MYCFKSEHANFQASQPNIQVLAKIQDMINISESKAQITGEEDVEELKPVGMQNNISTVETLWCFPRKLNNGLKM